MFEFSSSPVMANPFNRYPVPLLTDFITGLLNINQHPILAEYLILYLLEASDIKKYLDEPPILAFINGCESSQEKSWNDEIAYENQVFGLADAFLRCGAYYIGSLWPVHDDSAVQIAQDFYRCLLSGVSLGESLRIAKKNLFDKNGEKEFAWASYILYGDPTLTLLI